MVSLGNQVAKHPSQPRFLSSTEKNTTIFAVLSRGWGDVSLFKDDETFQLCINFIWILVQKVTWPKFCQTHSIYQTWLGKKQTFLKNLSGVRLVLGFICLTQTSWIPSFRPKELEEAEIQDLRQTQILEAFWRKGTFLFHLQRALSPKPQTPTRLTYGCTASNQYVIYQKHLH